MLYVIWCYSWPSSLVENYAKEKHSYFSIAVIWPTCFAVTIRLQICLLFCFVFCLPTYNLGVWRLIVYDVKVLKITFQRYIIHPKILVCQSQNKKQEKNCSRLAIVDEVGPKLTAMEKWLRGFPAYFLLVHVQHSCKVLNLQFQPVWNAMGNHGSTIAVWLLGPRRLQDMVNNFL